MKQIMYKAGYKYQLYATYQTHVAIKAPVISEYISLTSDGLLTIYKGYAWDGPSGPTIDTKSFMRGSLVHDALYQLIRLELLDASYREAADKELRRICLEDGMSKIRAWWVYTAVRLAGGPSARPENRHCVLVAP